MTGLLIQPGQLQDGLFCTTSLNEELPKHYCYLCMLMQPFHSTSDTIVALATPAGTGAIGVIRLSGPDAIAICDGVFATKELKPKNLAGKKPNTIPGVIHHDMRW